MYAEVTAVEEDHANMCVFVARSWKIEPSHSKVRVRCRKSEQMSKRKLLKKVQHSCTQSSCNAETTFMLENSALWCSLNCFLPSPPSPIKDGVVLHVNLSALVRHTSNHFYIVVLILLRRKVLYSKIVLLSYYGIYIHLKWRYISISL